LIGELLLLLLAVELPALLVLELPALPLLELLEDPQPAAAIREMQSAAKSAHLPGTAGLRLCTVSSFFSTHVFRRD
jgi:hypothetical protein